MPLGSYVVFPVHLSILLGSATIWPDWPARARVVALDVGRFRGFCAGSVVLALATHARVISGENPSSHCWS